MLPKAKEFKQELNLEGKTLKSPIFIAGEGRSGTRLLRNILGKHKNIYEINRETYIFVNSNFRKNSFYDKFCKNQDHELLILSILTGMSFKRSVAEEKIANNDFSADIVHYFNEIKNLPDYEEISCKYDAFNLCANYLTIKSAKERWVEKTPYNLYCTKEITKAYPEAKIVVIHRDPRAVVASWLKKDPLKSLLGVISSWNKASKQIKKLKEEMPNGQFYCLKYEDLVRNPETELRNLCAFLEEEFDPTMLDIVIVNSHVNKSQQGFSVASLERWKEKLSDYQKVLVDIFTSAYRKEFDFKCSGTNLDFFDLIGFFFFGFKEMLVYPWKKLRKLV